MNLINGNRNPKIPRVFNTDDFLYAGILRLKNYISQSFYKTENL